LYYSPALHARRVSAAAILRGVLAPKALANQVAIVGATAVGISDVAATPIGARMDGVEIHAQLIENILYGTRLIRPSSARWWELFGLVAFGIVLIVALAANQGWWFYTVSAVTLVIAISAKNFTLYDATFRWRATAGRRATADGGFSAALRCRREPMSSWPSSATNGYAPLGRVRAARESRWHVARSQSDEGIPGISIYALLEPAQRLAAISTMPLLDERRLFS
jgi:hypothetical protein